MAHLRSEHRMLEPFHIGIHDPLGLRASAEALSNLMAPRQALVASGANVPDDRASANVRMLVLGHLLHVFGETPSPQNRLVQMAACHELGSLVLHGLLAPVLTALAVERSVLPTRLPTWVAQDAPWASAWRGGPAQPSVHQHALAILDPDALSQATGAVAGSLYRRLQAERTWRTLAPELDELHPGNPRSSAVQLLHGIWTEHADIVEAWPILAPRLAERHLLVSRAAGTKPWFEPVQDRWQLVDLQIFQITTHAYQIRTDR